MNERPSVVVDVQWAVDKTGLPADADINNWVTMVVGAHQAEAELTVRIVDAQEITALNSQYRNQDKATNVLSFPADKDLPVAIPLLGDLVICAEVVALEAAEQNKTSTAHWAHMVIHGCLHLLGYDHIERDQAEQMEQKEINYMQKLDFPNPYEVITHS
ncbi:Metal-dependent hydrolase YbeY, involved in rRNA and/or ribosome maturation and assembly [hydrothermal vent metagenome]|uniref:Metal-dependent hydrolase YbeY, involved in rRNA and/or ribosome maturation and assembly n=1 Tax=hydrothermal vent metagenome TaxID=652676 RepID=A0A3B0ZMM8_9ZZZZ